MEEAQCAAAETARRAAAEEARRAAAEAAEEERREMEEVAALLLRQCLECGEADVGLLEDDESNPGDCYCVACWESWDSGEATGGATQRREVIYSPVGCAMLL